MESVTEPAVQRQATISPASTDKATVRSLSVQEPPGTGGKESNPDAFWLILRELRGIGEKLDTFVSGMEPGGFRKNSDKSYH